MGLLLAFLLVPNVILGLLLWQALRELRQARLSLLAKTLHELQETEEPSRITITSEPEPDEMSGIYET